MPQVATLALCLLSGCYGHAGDIVRIMGEQVLVGVDFPLVNEGVPAYPLCVRR